MDVYARQQAIRSYMHRLLTSIAELKLGVVDRHENGKLVLTMPRLSRSSMSDRVQSPCRHGRLSSAHWQLHAHGAL